MIFEFTVKSDHKDQHQSVPKTLETLTKVLCSSGPNLVILAWMGPKLSHGQAKGWNMDGRMETH